MAESTEGIGKMCGLALGKTVTWEAGETFDSSESIFPGEYVPVIAQAALPDQLSLRSLRWGLVPASAPKNQPPSFFTMFNARSESVQAKHSFKGLLPHNRVAVMLTGFYEWKLDWLGMKQPYYVEYDSGPMFIAALTDKWAPEEGPELQTVTMLTISSTGSELESLHDRRPLFLSGEALMAWLDTNAKEPDEALHLARAAEIPSRLKIHPCTKELNKNTYREADCSLPIVLETPGADIRSLFRAGIQDGLTKKIVRGSLSEPTERAAAPHEVVSNSRSQPNSADISPSAQPASEVLRLSGPAADQKSDATSSPVSIKARGHAFDASPPKVSMESSAGHRSSKCSKCTFINAVGSSRCEMCCAPILRAIAARSSDSNKRKRTSKGSPKEVSRQISSFFGKP